MTPEIVPLFPSTLPSPHPATIGIPPSEAGMVLAGFQDCAEEAIRFLTEVEGLPMDDPIVQGLKSHLHQCQMEIDYADILGKCRVVDMENDIALGSPSNNLAPASLNDSGISETLGFESVEDASNSNNVSAVHECPEYNERDNDARFDENDRALQFDNKEDGFYGSLQFSNPLIAKLTEELLFLIDQDDEDEDEDDVDEMIEEYTDNVIY